MGETLFNDSEVFSTERPKIITDKQKEEFLHEIAADIIKDGYSKSDKSYIIEDLRRINFNDSGFDIAKEIEDGNAYYNIDSTFIEFLEGLSWRRKKLLENNIKIWVKAHNPIPKFALGDKLTVDKHLCHGFKTGQEVYVNGIYLDRAIYLIDEDPNKKGGTVLEYERVEDSCSLQTSKQ